LPTDTDTDSSDMLISRLYLDVIIQDPALQMEEYYKLGYDLGMDN
jgi:hypothetical protein